MLGSYLELVEFTLPYGTPRPHRRTTLSLSRWKHAIFKARDPLGQGNPESHFCQNPNSLLAIKIFRAIHFSFGSPHLFSHLTNKTTTYLSTLAPDPTIQPLTTTPIH